MTKKALIQMGGVAPGASLTATNQLYNLRNSPSPVPPPRPQAKAGAAISPPAPIYQRELSFNRPFYQNVFYVDPDLISLRCMFVVLKFSINLFAILESQSQATQIP